MLDAESFSTDTTTPRVTARRFKATRHRSLTSERSFALIAFLRPSQVQQPTDTLDAWIEQRPLAVATSVVERIARIRTPWTSLGYNGGRHLVPLVL